MKIVVRRGLSVPVKGRPPVDVAADPVVGRVGLVGSDHRGMRAELLVAEGDAVMAGSPLYRDRLRPQIVFTAPVSGRVAEIVIGARRMMSAVSIAMEGEERATFETGGADTPEGVRAIMLKSGLWPQLRTRPFERIPDPDSVPDAIFVTAIDTRPHAPDPLAVLSEKMEAFKRGIAALALLTEGPLFVCQPDAHPLVEAAGPVKVARFSGPHPAGLVGTHIARLFPAVGKTVVWHIGYQDVAALGALLATGHVENTRVVALSGQGLRNSRLVRLPMGADLHDLVRAGLTPGQKHIVSGSALSGREVRYLSRYHTQMTVLDAPRPPRRNWLVDALHKAATVPAFIPTQALENAVAADVPIVPLLRALSIGDAETAQRLGCLQLAEEDLALATYATGGGVDFGQKLRAVLDTLEDAA